MIKCLKGMKRKTNLNLLKKLLKNKVFIFLILVMEEEDDCDMEGSRSGESDFIVKYKENLELETEKLEVSNKAKLTWVSKNISFVVAWVNRFLKEAKKEKNVFMNESCFDIAAEEYSLEFDEKTNTMNLRFCFNIDEE